jgi:hypothetical protein
MKKRFAFLYKLLNCNQKEEAEFQFEEIRAIDYYRADKIKRESEERLRSEYQDEINILKRRYIIILNLESIKFPYKIKKD